MTIILNYLFKLIFNYKIYRLFSVNIDIMQTSINIKKN